MGLYIRQDENRSKLQEKLAADLRAKAQAAQADKQDVDGVEDSEFVRGSQATQSRWWVWALVALFIALMIGIVLLN